MSGVRQAYWQSLAWEITLGQIWMWNREWILSKGVDSSASETMRKYPNNDTSLWHQVTTLKRKTVLAQKRDMFFHDVYYRCRNDYMHDIEWNGIAHWHFGYEEKRTEKWKKKHDPCNSLKYTKCITGEECNHEIDSTCYHGRDNWGNDRIMYTQWFTRHNLYRVINCTKILECIK